jgi:predicted RecB family nuclease
MAGLQCPLRLWRQVNDSTLETTPVDIVAQARMDTGTKVGELAQSYFPGGVLIEGGPSDLQSRCSATTEAIGNGYSVIYEASVTDGSLFAAIDILCLEDDGWVLREVKASTRVKPEYLQDVTIQLLICQRAGINVSRVEVVHLNKECRFPDLSNLFACVDVTSEALDLLPAIDSSTSQLFTALSETREPVVAVGEHCDSPHSCPYKIHCWPEVPEHHVSSLYRLSGTKAGVLAESGIETIFEIEDESGLSDLQQRQVRSVQGDRVFTSDGLAEALSKIILPAAFLDFETVSLAVPTWEGCTPYSMVPAQFSCHTMSPNGKVSHIEWLAEGQNDPRPMMAEALIRACAGSASVVAYNASFERRCIIQLAEVCPHLATQLNAINEKLVDLLPIVRDNVYHPEFHGSFSIKSVLPALTELGYDDLEVSGGLTAAVWLEQLMLGEYEGDVDALRGELLKYCGLDTLAMVELYKKLQQMSGAAA